MSSIPCLNYKFPDKNDTNTYYAKFSIGSTSELSKNDIVQLCADLAKKTKNLNCIESSHQVNIEHSTIDFDKN